MIWKIADRAAAQKIANRTGRGLFLAKGASGNLYASTEDITRGSSTLTSERWVSPCGFRRISTLTDPVGEISEADIEKMVAEILTQE